MGGRGTTSNLTMTREPEVIERSYEVINRASLMGQASYAFLDQLGRNWTVITRDAEERADYHPDDIFGMERPTLRWVNDSNVVDVFVDGLSAEEFFARSGLEFNLDKGGFVLSKRISRILRPQYATGFFDASEIDVRYMDLDDAGLKIWDGAGLVSRRMMERLIDQLPDVDDAKRARLLRELKHGKRVEFTVMTANGQDKGHAVVSENLDADFLLPRDTKAEVRLTNGQTFVGINFVHGHADMRLDIQSLINLYPFFEQRQLAQWLADEGTLFADSIQSGDVGAAMARIDRHTTLEDVESWPLREYLASGGNPMWFSSHVKSFANQHLKRLNESTLGKMRLPIPGGRFYVMPTAVGQRAGDNIQVGRGEIFIDPRYGTAWVNDDDWLQLRDSSEGIAGILGGADNDDALWVHPFTDHDGEQKVLAWRSPNQMGEFVVLKPTTQSDALRWNTPDGEISYPPADSRKLAPRIDTISPDYLNMVDPATAGGLGEGQDYNIEVMDATIERAIANRNALGAACNNLMLTKALYGRLPARPPAPLEDIIDASVKTGEDLSAVLQWTQQAAVKILEQRKPIPEVLQHRLGPRPPGTPQPVTSYDHWMDDLVYAVREHITEISVRRDDLVKQTMPPRAIFDHAFEQPETIDIGAKLSQTYTRAIRKLAREKAELLPEDYDSARREAESFLHRYPDDMHTSIVRGALVSAYIRDEPGSDAAVWLPGGKTDTGRNPGIANTTIQALREVGVLDEIAQTGSGVVTYPGAMVRQPSYRTVGINGVWMNVYNQWAETNGQPHAEKAADVPRDRARWAKGQVKQWAQSGEKIQLQVREETIDGEPRKAAYHPNGTRFGTIGRDSAADVGDTVTIQFAISHDGNLRVVV
jgi:hypothetical protein